MHQRKQMGDDARERRHRGSAEDQAEEPCRRRTCPQRQGRAPAVGDSGIAAGEPLRWQARDFTDDGSGIRIEGWRRRLRLLTLPLKLPLVLSALLVELPLLVLQLLLLQVYPHRVVRRLSHRRSGRQAEGHGHDSQASISGLLFLVASVVGTYLDTRRDPSGPGDPTSVNGATVRLLLAVWEVWWPRISWHRHHRAALRRLPDLPSIPRRLGARRT
jgi:hypothetical protein